MLSKDQLAQKNKFTTHFHIWERDLLECARRWAPWRTLARKLGFTDKKIEAPWTFKDAGKLIQYAEINKVQLRRKMTHKRISYVKSAVRILGFLFLSQSPVLGCSILIAAEIIGVIEEFEE